MNTYMAMGLFAFFVAVISLLRLTAEHDVFRVRLMKRSFGRKLGLSLYFITNVATPIVVGLLFFCGGISADETVPSMIVDNPLPEFFQTEPAGGESSTAADDLSFLS